MFTLVLTVIVLQRPRGPQPAAYGHIQTLANVVDKWTPTMWWGHKTGGFPFGHAGGCHFRRCSLVLMTSGTSDSRLSKVDMDALYA